MRIHVLGSAATPDDHAELAAVTSRIPQSVLPRYVLSLNLRHPTLADPKHVERLVQILATFMWPHQCCDITDSALYQPVLPEGTPPCDVP